MNQSIREVVADGIIQQYDVPRPKKYWQRNKKQSINYAYDSPFATERQLEDQRLLQQKNRNPQYFVPTKVEKVRSEVLIQKQGASRSVAVKANVVNKIVREASGIHNYAIVAPPKAKKGQVEEEKIDPETHPLMAPYAKEAKSKPIIVSFGHRPKSASRTFHPASMKFKLTHSEVIQTRGANSGFGLPVAVLSKVLTAPKILSESEILEQLDSEEKSHAESQTTMTSTKGNDPNNLFFSEKEESAVFGSTSNASLGDNSWISSIEQRQKDKKNKKKIKLQPLSEQRPQWDETFNRIKMTNKERLALKESAMLKGEILPLKERCKRFAVRAVADPPEMYCSEKQDLDKRAMAGETLKVPKAVPQKPEYPIWYDPYTENLEEVTKMHQKRIKETQKAKKAWKYQEDLYAIPKSEYFPTTALVEMRSKSSISKTSGLNDTYGSLNGAYGTDMDTANSAVNLESSNTNSNTNTGLHLYHAPSKTKSANTSSNAELASATQSTAQQSSPGKLPTGTYSSKYSPGKLPGNTSKYLQDDGEWAQFEKDLKNAVKAAKHGDTNALYNFTMKREEGEMGKLERPYSNEYSVDNDYDDYDRDASEWNKTI